MLSGTGLSGTRAVKEEGFGVLLQLWLRLRGFKTGLWKDPRKKVCIYIKDHFNHMSGLFKGSASDKSVGGWWHPLCLDGKPWRRLPGSYLLVLIASRRVPHFWN